MRRLRRLPSIARVSSIVALCSALASSAAAADLLLGRRPSAFAHDQLSGGALRVVWTAYNEGVDAIAEPVLAIRLQAGVTLVASDPPATVRGADVLIPLATVPGSGEASATVDLTVGGSVTAVDAGATVAGNLRTRAVRATAPQVRLRPTLGTAASLVAAIPEADPGDATVQRAVARLGCDPASHFAFLRDGVGYEVYRGSLRGARGTLWSGAGNALDRASLLVGLLRACGHPARYASGTLDAGRAADLVAAMFPPPGGATGGLPTLGALPGLPSLDQLLLEASRLLPGGGTTSDPASDPMLVAEARQHHWVEYHDGAGFVPLDPSFPDAEPGDTVAATAQTFAEPSDALRHTVRFTLAAELLPTGLNATFIGLAAALGDEIAAPGVSFANVGNLVVERREALDATLPVVSLVGEPVQLGHFVSATGASTTYDPWLQIGAAPTLVRGTAYQEQSGPVAGNALSGLRLGMTLREPGGTEHHHERMLVDRLGVAVRNGEPTGPLALVLDDGPTLSDLDVVAVHVLPGRQEARDLDAVIARAATTGATADALLAALPPNDEGPAQAAAIAAQRAFHVELTALLGKATALASARQRDVLERTLHARTWAAVPQLVVTQARSRGLDGSGDARTLAIDLRRNELRAVAAPGQRALAARVLATTRGLFDSALEARLLDELVAAPVRSVFDVFAAARTQGLRLTSITPADADAVDLLPLTSDARAWIRTAADAGRAVVVPSGMVLLDGVETVQWLELDPVTGDAIAVDASGGHQSAVEYGALAKKATKDLLKGYKDAVSLKEIPDLRSQLKPAGGGGSFDPQAYVVDLILDEGGFKSPWGYAGVMVGTAQDMLFAVAGAVVAATSADPPLPSLLVDPSPTGFARTSASVVVAGDVVLGGGANVDATGTSPYTRAGATAFYGDVVAPGLAAGGTDAVALAFDASAARTLAAASLNLDLASGSLVVGGTNVAPPAHVGLTGVSGSLGMTDAGAVTVDATFARALVVTAMPPDADLAAGESVVIEPTLATDAADTFTLTVEVPPGFDVVLAADGAATITVPPGATGTADVVVCAQSVSTPELRASTIVSLEIGDPAVPAVDVRVVHDPIWSLPIDGTLAPVVQRIEIANRTGATGTFDVVVDGLAAEDYTLGTPAVTLAAGAVGTIGLALHPAGGILPAGTPVGFTVTATQQTSGLFDSESVNLVYPEVVGITPTLAPLSLTTVPGTSLGAVLTLEGRGNVAVTAALDVTSDAGVVGVPATVTLSPGDSQVLPLDLTVGADVPLGTTLPVVVTVDLCNGNPSCTLPEPTVRATAMALLVGTADVACLLDAAGAAGAGGLVEPAIAFHELGDALARLSVDPDDAQRLSDAMGAGNAVLALLAAQGLDAEATALHAALASIEGGGDDFDDVCASLTSLPATVTALAERLAYGVTLTLAPTSRVVAPGETATYALRAASTGTRPTTVALSASGLAPGIDAELDVASLSLAPGEVREIAATLTLSAAATTGGATGFLVTGQVLEEPSVTVSTPGVFAARESAVDVTSVLPAPRLAEDAGDPVAVRATLANRANVARAVRVVVRVEDGLGTTVLAPAPVSTTLGTGAASNVDLGSLDTSTLDDGPYTAIVTVQTDAGGAIPGREGRASFLVGLPFQARVVADPAEVPPGKPVAVTSRVQLRGPDLGTGGAAFADQYAKAVVAAMGVADADDALGPPDRESAVVPMGEALVLDLGADLDRVTDGPDADLVVFEQADGGCQVVHTTAYEVAVADDPDGPFVVLGSASGTRVIGDEFDLLEGAVTSARYLRITPQNGMVEIDAVLVAHPARPGHVRLEQSFPMGFENGMANTPIAGDLDQDGNPEIVVNVQTSSIDCDTVVLDGVTGEEKFRVHLPQGRSGLNIARCGETASPAIGDVDADGTPELVINTEISNRLIIVGPDGTEEQRLVIERGASSPVSPVNLDGDPQAEYPWFYGFRQDDGSLAVDRIELFFAPPIALDVTGDQLPELIATGRGVVEAWSTTGTFVWSSPAIMTGPGAFTSRPAAADLNGDGIVDLAVVGRNNVFIDDPGAIVALSGADGSVLWRTDLAPVSNHCELDETIACDAPGDCPGGNCVHSDISVGPPAIADVDGNGKPDVIAAVRRFAGVAEDDVVAWNGQTGAELWHTEASDPFGDPPGIAAADLDGDGADEVLWNGACDGFTIFSGADGRVLYRDPRATSPSSFDHPSAADVDADGHLEVLAGSVDGLYVFGADGGFAGGRTTWNQADYRVTNVEDDLGIPTAELPSWKLHNSWRAQRGDVGDLSEASVTVTHTLADGVSFDAGDVEPAASVADREITWTASFPTVAGASFGVPVTLDPLAAGEVRPVSDATTVEATLTLADGAEVTATVPLEPTVVYAPHAIGISPASQAVTAGSTATFTVTLRNGGTVDELFTLDVLGIEPTWIEVPAPVLVGAGAEVTVMVTVTPPSNAPAADYDVVVGVAGDQGTTDDAGATLSVSALPVPYVAGAIGVALAPSTVTAGQGGNAVFDVVVASGLAAATEVTLSATLPSGITGSFLDETLVVSPGIGGRRVTRLTLSVPSGTAPGALPIGVHVASGNLEASAGGTLVVSARGVTLVLSPDPAAIVPGESLVLTATVKNTGSVQDTFDLAVGGPLGAFATLGVPSVTLAAGASAGVSSTLDGLDALLAQRSYLLVTAVSRNEAAVRAMDAAALDVGVRRAVAAVLTPLVSSLPAPGTTSAVLEITNTGNACDERYQLVFTSTPAGVVLTPAVTQFLVPPGATASIALVLTAPASGDFSLEAVVTTRTDNPLCPSLPAGSATAPATLSVAGEVVGGAPTAEAGADRGVFTGTRVALDGGASSDPDGDALGFVWTFDGIPAASALVDGDIAGADTATPSFVPDVNGRFVLALRVSDGAGQRAVDTTVVRAEPFTVQDLLDVLRPRTGTLVEGFACLDGGVSATGAGVETAPLERCDDALGREGLKLAQGRQLSLGRCVDALVGCHLDGDGMIDAKCGKRAERTCAREERKIGKLTSRARGALQKGCGAVALSTIQAALGTTELCASLDLPLGSTGDLLACVERIAVCVADDAIESTRPLAGALLAGAGRAGMAPCIAPLASVVALDVDARGARRCAHAMAKLADQGATGLGVALGDCGDDLLGCALAAESGELSETKAAKCRSRAAARCTRRTTKQAARMGKARRTAVSRCGALPAATFAQGLGYEALADGCAAFDPPQTSDGPETTAACMLRATACTGG